MSGQGKPDRAKQLRRDVLEYAIGLGFALALTGAAFASVWHPTLLGRHTLAVVLGLALVQAVVHFRFFLHVRLTRSSRDDLLLLLFTALIITLMVGGTLVLLANLRMRMM